MRPLSWLDSKIIPRGCAAVLSALQFQPGAGEALRTLDDADWPGALNFADNARLTLLLGHNCQQHLPPAIAARISSNLEANRRHVERLSIDYLQIADHLASAGVEHVLLKGFLHAPRFVPDASLRQQYDIDLLFQPQDVRRAHALVKELGYEPAFGPARYPTDHLPPLVRKTGWQWRGDFFDPEMPTTVELHFRLWDEQTEGFTLEGLDRFWERRETRPREGRPVPALAPADQLGYAALHLLRHLLRGDVTPFHVYELAYFLETSADDGRFWASWAGLSSPTLRHLQSPAYGLAARWFGCRLPQRVKQEIANWPTELDCWCEHYAAAPIEALFRPNKDELWLHLSLLPRFADRLRVLRRRLVPFSAPNPSDTIFIPRPDQTVSLRFRKAARYTGFVLSRVRFHLQTLVTTALGAWLWRRRRSRFAEKAQLG